MNKSRLLAFAMALAISATAAVSCSEKTSESQPTEIINATTPTSENVPNKYSGDSAKIDSEFGQGTTVNDTVFTLNDVVSLSGLPNMNGNDVIYLNVTIKNNTDIAYDITSLNNFYIALPDETELSMDVRTVLYATNNYTKCVDDPISIPAQGEFTGYLKGGFIVPAGTDNFTVGFFPTLANTKDDSKVIVSHVSPENITHDDSALK